MAVKQINIIELKNVVSQLLLSAGVGYDKESNRLVSLHGTDVLFNKKDPESLDQYGKAVARAVMMSLPEDHLIGLKNAAAALFSKEVAAVDNFHLPRMFSSDNEVEVATKLLADVIGANAAQTSSGHIARVGIVALDKDGSTGKFQLQATFNSTRGMLTLNGHLWVHHKEKAIASPEFCKMYSVAIHELEGVTAAPIPRVPDDKGAELLFASAHPMFVWHETIGSDFLMVDFEIDQDLLALAAGEFKLPDEKVKAKDRLFVSTANTLYDKYLKGLVLKQAMQDRKFHAVSIGAYEVTSVREMMYSPMTTLENRERLIRDPNSYYTVPIFGLVGSFIMNEGSIHAEQVMQICRVAERNRHTCLVEAVLGDSWKELPMRGAPISVTSTSFGIQLTLMEDYVSSQAIAKLLPKELIDRIISVMQGEFKERHPNIEVTLSESASVEGGLVHKRLRFVLQDVNASLEHLIADVRDTVRILAIEHGCEKMIPAFTLSRATVEAFECAVRDEAQNGVTDRAVLNAMRRTFLLHDIPNAPGKEGSFFRDLEAIDQPETAKVFVATHHYDQTCDCVDNGSLL